MRRSAGHFLTLLIVSATPASSQGKLPIWTATAELRIDGATENLSDVNWVAVSPRGTVVITQPQDKLVLFFSATGKRIGSFGRAGEGPGDFRGVGRMGWAGDTLWIGDYMLRRTTYISPEFKHIRDVPDPPPANPGAPETDPCFVRQGGSTMSNPFCARTVHNAAPDSSRIATVTQSNPTTSNGSYTVTVTRHNGEKVFSQLLTMSSVAIPKQYADSMTDLMARRMGPAAKSFYQETMPSYFQPVQVAFVGIDGTTWLMYWAAPGTAMRQYVILAPNGDPLATVILPKSIVPQVISRHTMWGVVTDADGIDSVVRYRVQ